MESSESLQMAYELAIGVVIDCARKVTVFDGTDRNSLDDLREALAQLGAVNDSISKYFKAL